MLGIICALNVIHLTIPEPFGPAFLQIIMNDQNVHSLTPDFVAFFYPELRVELQNWRDMGRLGDTKPFQSHFVSHHNCPASAYGTFAKPGRTQETHDIIMVDMLLSALIGIGVLGHDELNAFQAGFALPVKNEFSWLQMVHSFQGGSFQFLQRLYNAPAADTILAHLNLDGCMFRIAGTSMAVIIQEFVTGAGIPCPGLMEGASGVLDRSYVDLEQANDPDFRARILTYAICGRPGYPANPSDKILIKSASVEDRSYTWAGATAADMVAMARAGKWAFHTCTSFAQFPTDHLEVLMDADYDGVTEPKDLRQAIDHWLFCEFVGAIGGVSIM
ncbi:hypothetical protein SISSUDRAFT_1066746 [Sistotremastrum suecicum HHB10207 ss-3]|uniref:Uncharacterized protein n=1 Tax=Sistotremastrum suecicum HHB10207 ss-3 TaxID=1314776 RepID=A0A165XYG5_9AGAM|nr:hypothetical protein SISSUDRAFT_1066746 [Sistotremastrum suecicum HHB10207 ss-3]